MHAHDRSSLTFIAWFVCILDLYCDTSSSSRSPTIHRKGIPRTSLLSCLLPLLKEHNIFFPQIQPQNRRDTTLFLFWFPASDLFPPVSNSQTIFFFQRFLKLGNYCKSFFFLTRQHWTEVQKFSHLSVNFHQENGLEGSFGSLTWETKSDLNKINLKLTLQGQRLRRGRIPQPWKVWSDRWPNQICTSSTIFDLVSLSIHNNWM